MRTEIILGPPGTGKTTALLAAVEEELGRGTPPDRIGYVSFTRRAAQEAVARACAKFKLSPRDFPFFRTLHSLCYHQLGLKRSDVFQGTKLREFGDYAGVSVTGHWTEEGSFEGYEVGDRILFMENLARTRMVNLKASFIVNDDDLGWTEVDRTAKALAQFKQNRGLVDFTDMLSEFVNHGDRPQIEVLLVDEVQDLSRLQWSVVDKLCAGCRRVAVAGDDDQAIYAWAGADVEHLIEMDGDARVLGRSWRVPIAVQRVASEVISGVAHRRLKEWLPRDADGVVDRVGSFSEVDCDGPDVLILARNAFVLREQVEDELRQRGIVYEKQGGEISIPRRILDGIETWERLRKGAAVTGAEARVTYESMRVGSGVARGHKRLPGVADEDLVTMASLRERGGLLRDDVWHEALELLPSDDMSYILAARRRGEKLRDRPHVRISTIHGSKGGEAAHVVLFREMARRTYREMESAPDDERRVWYVGATRARERLTIVDAETELACPWL
jgi:DNA helicase-2/ATP-dependent DNA helicase PcrA